MDKPSKSTGKMGDGVLRIEELEERIAPVIVTSDPSTWIQSPGGPQDGTPPLPGGPGWPGDGGLDRYWIFYIGPGQADIRGANGGTNNSESINGLFIGNVTIENTLQMVDTNGDGVPDTQTITSPDLTSGLFILDYPIGDSTPDQKIVMWPTQAGTIQVVGKIEVFGDIGCIEIDGNFGVDFHNGYGVGSMEVHGTLGRLDVGVLTASRVHATGDIYEIDSDTLIGSGYDVQNSTFLLVDTVIAADGNIGAIRAGVGLTDGGSGVTSTGILGGNISGTTLIEANADGMGAPGQIDLIEAVSGSMFNGDFGVLIGDNIPRISAGHGGNVRFIHLEGTAWYGGTSINEYDVTSSSPALERTIVDDSGGVMVIHPIDHTYATGGGGTVTYPAQVFYLLIPVDRELQGPGAVVARLTMQGENTFSITGSVDVGEVRFGPIEAFPEENSPALDATFAANLTQIKQLTDLKGIAHDTFGGTGETDIYFVNAMNAHAGAGPEMVTSIPILINNTHDGDILSIGADGDVVLVSASNDGGDIGATEGISPFILRGPLHYSDGDILWVDINTAANSPAITPYGVEGSLMRMNSVYGAFVTGDIWGLRAGGAIGDVHTTSGAIHLVAPDSNNERDPGSPLVMSNIQIVDGLHIEDTSTPPRSHHYPHPGTVSFFGRIENTVGDGIFGRVTAGSSNSAFKDSNAANWATSSAVTIGIVRVGEGLQKVLDEGPFTLYDYNFYPENSPQATNAPGFYINSGIYTGGVIQEVIATNTASDNATGHDRGIFGDVIGQGGVQLVTATNGAIIGNSDSFMYILAASVCVRTTGIIVSGNVDQISSSGPGGGIFNTDVIANSVGRIVTSGGTTGMDGLYVTTFDGGVGTISADGPGITNSNFFFNGPSGTIETTSKGGMITGTSVYALIGLEKMSSDGLENCDINVVTIGHISAFDHIYGTTLQMGGLNQLTVRHDIGMLGTRETIIDVAGPINNLTVGGSITGTDIDVTGPYGNIRNMTVAHGIGPGAYKDPISGETVLRPSTITTSGTIGLVRTTDSADGTIDATITSTGTRGTVRIESAKDVAGTWNIANTLTLLSAKGNIDADITAAKAGTIKAGGAIDGDITVGGNASSIRAGGDITGDITVAGKLNTLQSGGAIIGNIEVDGTLNAIKSAGTLGAEGNAITAGKLGHLTVGSKAAPADIVSNIYVTGNATSILASGAILGNIDVGGNLSTLSASAQTSGFTGGQISVGGNLGRMTMGSSSAPASLLSDVVVGGNVGSIKVSGDWSGSFKAGDVDRPAKLRAGNVGSISVGGDWGRDDGSGSIDIAGNLSSLKVGAGVARGTSDSGNLLSAMVIHNSVGSMAVAGNVEQAMEIMRNASSISVGGAIANQDFAMADGHNTSYLQIHGNLGTLKMSGDDWGDIDIGGNAGRIISDPVTGRIIANVNVHGNLGYLITGSAISPGTSIQNWVFTNTVPDPNNPGSMTVVTTDLKVDGKIGRIVL